MNGVSNGEGGTPSGGGIYPALGFDGFSFGAEETPEGLFDWGTFSLSLLSTRQRLMRMYRSMVLFLLKRS